MKKTIQWGLSFFFMIALAGPLFAYEISGEISSIDLDVRTINVKTWNPFTKKEFFKRLAWVMDSPEGISLRDLKPGDFVRVKADKDSLGRYFVKKVLKAQKRQG